MAVPNFLHSFEQNTSQLRNISCIETYSAFISANLWRDHSLIIRAAGSGEGLQGDSKSSCLYLMISDMAETIWVVFAGFNKGIREINLAKEFFEKHENEEVEILRYCCRYVMAASGGYGRGRRRCSRNPESRSKHNNCSLQWYRHSAVL